MTSPNPQCLAVARLCENLAQTVANTLDHIRTELAHTDGLKAATTDGPGGRSADPTTPTERATLQRLELIGHRDQIHDDIRTMALIVYSCQETCRKAAGTRIQHEVPRCTADPGVDGYDLPLTEGGWHDPLCRALPRSNRGGLCDACRKRLARYRERMELKPLDDERPIQFDSKVTITDQGVALVRPLDQAS